MQGFNMGRYVPPDQEGVISANKLQNKRAPGTLRKDGTQTIRFEMPFAVWCHTCQPHAILGRGTRYNAIKTKVDKYYTTPIWSFRMTHQACGGTIEIRTDPKNAAYVVTAGGQARDYGEDRVREGENGVPILTAEERERRRENAFASLEAKTEETAQVKDNTKRIQELYESRARDWDDPAAANQRLRDNFRRERKVRHREERATEALQDRLGTSIDLLPATEEDAKRAKLVSYGRSTNSSRDSLKPMVKTPMQKVSSASSARKETPLEALRRRVLANTRERLNPFG